MATTKRDCLRVEVTFYREDEPPLKIGRLTSIKSWADESGRLNLVSLKTYDLEAVAGLEVDGVGNLEESFFRQRTGVKVLTGRFGSLKVVAILPEWKAGLPARATVYFAPDRPEKQG